MFFNKASLKLVFISILYILNCYAENKQESTLDGSPVSEFRGYPKREHSLIRPYQGILYFNLITFFRRSNGNSLLGNCWFNNGNSTSS